MTPRSVTRAPSVKLTVSPRVTSLRVWVNTMLSPCTSAVVGGPSATRCSFTSNRSAKSASTASSSRQYAGSLPTLRNSMSSRMPRPIQRRRNSIKVESARPALGRGRGKRSSTAKGSASACDKNSGRAPLSRSSNRLNNRESRKNSPCGEPATMSPEVDETQNDEPSTSEHTPPALPITGGSAAKVQGSVTCGRS